jgi:hypothetical protein
MSNFAGFLRSGRLGHLNIRLYIRVLNSGDWRQVLV